MLATIAFPNESEHCPAVSHDYDPFDFTHQGATFINPVLPTGRLFGTDADNALLDSNLVKAMNFMTRTGRVPFMGEMAGLRSDSA